LPSFRPRLRALIPAAIALAFFLGLVPATPVAAAKPTEAAQIIAIARHQLGHRFRFGAVGPKYFDCSGLVIYAYRKAGDGKVLGRNHRTVGQLYRWFKTHGLANRRNPQLGDLVVWGGNRHIGIYIGQGRVISALTRGVVIHRISAFRLPFTAYLHTGMNH
jgi:cell wall-associated NlpC family hydrolase